MSNFINEFNDELVDALRKPLCVDQIEFRPKSCNDKGQCSVLWYMTGRAPVEVLDMIVGPQNWTQRTMKMEQMKSGEWYAIVEIILFPDKISDVELRPRYVRDGVGIGDDPKAAYSDALKRAWFQWSHGARILYKAPTIRVKSKKYGRSTFIDNAEYPRLYNAYRDLVKDYFGIMPCESIYEKGGSKREKTKRGMKDKPVEYPKTFDEWLDYFISMGSVKAARDAYRALPSEYKDNADVIDAGKKAAEQLSGEN